jgi:tetratricopeptide (TPR) repeat protein
MVMQQKSIPDLERFLKLQEATLGESSEVAVTASTLAELYTEAGIYDSAESMYQRVLKIRDSLPDIYKRDFTNIEERLSKIAQLKSGIEPASCTRPEETVEETDAESEVPVKLPTFRESVSPHTAVISSKDLDDKIVDLQLRLELLQATSGSDCSLVADLMTQLADLYCRKKMFSDMDPLLTKALSIKEKAHGADHPAVATALKNLAMLYSAERNHEKAKAFFARALAIRQKVYGLHHPKVQEIEQQYSALLG